MKIKHVSFDIWNTLLRSNPFFHEERAKYFQQISPNNLRINEIHTIVKDVGHYCDRIEIADDVLFTPRQRLLMIMSKLGIESDELLVEHFNQVDALAKFHLPIVIDESIREKLLKLQSTGIGLSLTSNTGNLGGNIMRQLLDRVDMFKQFSFAVFSDEIGGCKPHARIFNKLISGAGVCPEEILHVGDSYDADIAGATKFGLKSLLFTPKTPNYDDIFTNFGLDRA